MAYDADGGEYIPQRRSTPHYHGDEVRGLFVVSALVIIFAQSTGAELPLSTMSAVISSAALVIAAGITSPKLSRIHWVNALFAVSGTILFGRSAVSHYRDGFNVFEPSFLYVEALAVLFLIALYFTTRTVRAILLHTFPM